MHSELDHQEMLLDAWRTNNRVTIFLVEHLPRELWGATVPGAPRRTVRMIAGHIHIGPSQRQKGTRFGAKLVFWGLVFVPVTLAFALLVKSPYLFVISLIIVLAGLGRVLYARLFEEVQCSPKQDAQSVLVRDYALLNSPDVSHTNSNSFSPSQR